MPLVLVADGRGLRSGRALQRRAEDLLVGLGIGTHGWLQVIPDLPAGVLIHVHDIFIPYDYPREWVVEERWGWTEQYLAVNDIKLLSCAR